MCRRLAQFFRDERGYNDVAINLSFIIIVSIILFLIIRYVLS
ncbi:hypothetical protein MOTE_10530 [Moorella thermoacetica]|uniref:Uncharacterized protein n=1 Tax=Neomoorella thermoacetica TaxID=1525 RepID=A0A1J5P7H1_NEOTH|nr:hypothetical protein MOTE_10530 [Moorella thermoacetica]